MHFLVLAPDCYALLVLTLQHVTVSSSVLRASLRGLIATHCALRLAAVSGLVYSQLPYLPLAVPVAPIGEYYTALFRRTIYLHIYSCPVLVVSVRFLPVTCPIL